MTESLPLIPEKGGNVCGDVRPVLREVFREYQYLPALAPRAPPPPRDRAGEHSRLPSLNQWIEKYDSDRKELWERESELKQQYAKRVSRDPLPNIYKLQPSPIKLVELRPWRRELGMLERRDLVPSVIQKSDVEETLWVRNVLNGSSGDVTPMVVQGAKVTTPVQLAAPRGRSVQSLSIGEVVQRFQLRSPPRAAPPHAPDHVLCVPPQLDFVNFTVGHLHSQSIRLVNVSNCEVRLSVRPPTSRELDLELCSARGLTVTSGAAAEIRVNFRPVDVRVVRDVLVVRVSSGKLLHVPITCYMQPPFLDILVPVVSASLLSCSAETGLVRSSDCLELGARLLGDVHCVPVLFYCEAEHAAFFLLTEDAWLSFSLDVVTSRGSVVATPFVVWPAWWQGGGSVRGCVWCHADAPGLHSAALRLVATTAVVRPLHLIADALHFRPEHVTLEAHEKDYDICSEDDPACEYYVHLGTAFPHRSLSATVQLLNHSPVVYSYYWSVRPWGECTCWEKREEEEQRDQEKQTKSNKRKGRDELNEKDEQSKTKSDESSVGSGETSTKSSGLCIGAKEARDKELLLGPIEENEPSSASWVRVEPARGSLAPRSSCGVHVCAPDVGARLGLQRAVLMLILKDIPKESLRSDYGPMIVKTDVVDSDPLPGVKRWSREICEIVCAQMEVWWEVVPVRFVLDPPSLCLNYSRRLKSVEVRFRATQLFGSEGVSCRWSVPTHVETPPPPLLTAEHSCPTALRYRLPVLPNAFPETDLLTLEAGQGEWQASSSVMRACSTRHPALHPARSWLGVVPPGAAMRTSLHLYNDTYQHICWWASPFRWWRENKPRAVCVGHKQGEGVAPCERCHERACTCAIIHPTRGALHHHQRTEILYNVHAPESDGCVATLVSAQRTSADVARVAGGAGTAARASLVAYRVLAPRLVLRSLPCTGDKHSGFECESIMHSNCEACALDEGGASSARGTATLRPRMALTVGHHSCYRLQFTNLTPLPTSVTWDTPLEEDVLKVIFEPKQFDVGGYATVTTQVVVKGRRVCGRRVFVYRALVQAAYKPLYLLIDAAVTGLEIVCEVPLGGAENTDTTVIMRRTQREVYPWEQKPDSPRLQLHLPTTYQEIFADEDTKRAHRAANVCRCKCQLQYIPPPAPRPRPPPKEEDDYPPIEITNVCRCKCQLQYIPPPAPRPRPPPKEEDDYPPIEIICSETGLTRVCACHSATAPVLPDFSDSLCLQFHRVPLRTVRTRTVVIRNESVVSAAWGTALRRYPRNHTPTLNKDQWAGDVCTSGVVVQCWPPSGVVSAHATLRLAVRVYADSWGLYHDQLAIKMENLEAIVVDIWIEAVGPPLQFALTLTPNDARDPVLCWMSRADPERVLRVKNTSRAPLCVHAYSTTMHDHEQDALPFRLYIRLFDVLPPSCPCLTAYDSSEESEASSYSVEMDTGIELYLAPDHGVQCDSHYKVRPNSRPVSPGEWVEWRVRLVGAEGAEGAPPGALLLRSVPLQHSGVGWRRVEPPAQVVVLRQAERAARLQLACHEVRVRLCALHLPYADIMRVRRRFVVANVGSGFLEVCARTELPWLMVEQQGGAAVECGAGCACAPPRARVNYLALRLHPRSSLEMCVEVEVCTAQAWPPTPPAPPAPPAYPPRLITTTPLQFYDQHNVLETLPLVLELEYPVLMLEPALIEFGFITDGDSRKSYFTLTHSSPTESIEVVAEWEGAEGFELWPRALRLRPAATQYIYIQYTAKWCGAPAEGCVCVRAAGGAGAWCLCAARARAVPARDLARRAVTHDHTDDTHLHPPDSAHRALCL